MRPLSTVHANWSGFISQDGSQVNVSRTDLIDSLQATTYNEDENKAFHWRKHFGEVIYQLMEKVDSEEMTDLLVKNGYINLNSYIRVAAASGLTRQQAQSKFKELTKG